MIADRPGLRSDLLIPHLRVCSDVLREQGVSTKTDRESQEVGQEIVYIGTFAHHLVTHIHDKFRSAVWLL